MVLQALAQMSQGRHQLQSQMHELQERHSALGKELATEKQQHGDTEQQLSGVQQDNCRLACELKARRLVYDFCCLNYSALCHCSCHDVASSRLLNMSEYVCC